MGYLRTFNRAPDAASPIAPMDWLSVLSLWFTVWPGATEAWCSVVEIVRVRVKPSWRDDTPSFDAFVRVATRKDERAANIVVVIPE